MNSVLNPRNISRSGLVALVLMAASLVAAIAVYLPGLSGPFILDDLPQLNGLIEHGADAPGSLIEGYAISSSGPFGRPVAMYTFIANAMTHGPDTWWWKYNNLMFHLIGGLLVFWLTRLLINATGKQDGGRQWLAAAVVSAFWLLHPLQVSTVLYTVQRMTELSTLFVLAGLVCYVAGRQRQVDARSGGWRLIGVAFGVFFPLALFSKESALLFPVYCSLVELVIFRLGGSGESQKQVRLLHIALGAGYLVSALYLLANFSAIVLDGYAARDFTLGERVLTQARVLVQYLGQILRPVQSEMGFFHDDLVVSTSLLDPLTTLFSVLLLAALLASAVVLFRRLPLYAFGILFFFAAHALESTVFALELMYEHRNYLASYGVLLAVLALVQAIPPHRATKPVVAIVLVAVSLLTWQRAMTWSSPGTFYEYAYRVHPESPRLNYVFATIYTDMGDYDGARQLIARTDNGMGPGIHGLFIDCLEHGSLDDDAIARMARQPYGQADGYVLASIELLTEAILDRKCAASPQSMVALMDALSGLPARKALDRQTFLFGKARILEADNRLDGALAALRSAFEMLPGNTTPLYVAANMLTVSGRFEEAQQMLTLAHDVARTVSLQNRAAAESVYLRLGNEFVVRNELEKALEVYSEANVAIPAEPVFYLATAETLMRLQRAGLAAETLVALRSLGAEALVEHQYALEKLERLLP